MSSILILSDDYIFGEAITVLLKEVKSDVSTQVKKDAVTDIYFVTWRGNIDRTLAANRCSALIVNIHDNLNARTISLLNRIKREYPLIRIMVFVNEIVDYQNPFIPVLMPICDILVNRYESIPGIKRNLTQLGLLMQHGPTRLLNRFSRTGRIMLNSTDSMLSALSKREREVMNYLAQGKSPTEIAEELYVSPKTVYTHRHRIYAKLGVRNIIELHKIMRISAII